MARSKRDNKRSMGTTGQTQAMSIEEYMGQTLGDWDSIRSPHKYMNAVPISIFDIYPDATQPRRAIPKVVRDRWHRTDNAKKDMKKLFTIWEAIINDLRPDGSPPFDLLNYLGQEAPEERTAETTTYDNDVNPVEYALVKVADVALSIRKYGLSNPITVAPLVPNGYVIETGERRWLAYHLLHAKDLKTQQTEIDDDFSAISARKVDHVSVWRQAAENGARDDLNAIAKARQIAVLTMDLHREFNSAEFDSLESFEHQRHFYAQIYSPATEKFLHAIRGTQDHIIAAVGLKSGRQVSQYRKLLTLPDEAWDLADDHNLSEYALRQVVDNKQATDQERIEMVKAIVRGEHTTKAAETSAISLKQEGEDKDSGTVVPSRNEPTHNPGRSGGELAPDPDHTGDLAVPTPKFFANAARAFNRIQADKPQEIENARYYLEKIQAYLQNVEARLKKVETEK